MGLIKCMIGEAGGVVGSTPEGMGCHIYFVKYENDTRSRGPTRFQITYALVEISFQNKKSVFKTQIQFSKCKSPLKYTKSVFKS